jgi:glycerophosphoryl diester phosphodiesterase
MAPGWLTKKPYAHRGLHSRVGGVAENSPSGFRAAVANGYGIELDVQETRDGEALVFHDYDLARLTGETGPVAERDLADLEKIALTGTEDRLPSLAHVLDMVAGRAPILIEVKTRKREVGRLEAAVARVVSAYAGPAVVMSFNIRSVIWFRDNAPEIPRGLVATDYAHGGKDLPLSVALLPLGHSVKRCGADFLAYDFRLLPTRATEHLRRNGMPVLTWTVKQSTDRRRAERVADAIIFEGWRP